MTGEGPLNTNQEEEGFSIKEPKNTLKEVEIMQLWLLNKKQLQGLLSTRMPQWPLPSSWKWHGGGTGNVSELTWATALLPSVANRAVSLTNVMPGMSELNRGSLLHIHMPSGSGLCLMLS